MGSAGSVPNDGTLQVAYKGPVDGRLPKGVEGVVLGRTGAVESRVSSSIYNSLGSLEDVQLVGYDDLDEFEIEVDNPEKANYVPFFFNRRGEYGRKHSYWESLCHVSGGQDRTKFLRSASARYSTPIAGTSIESLLCPATVEICALVESIRSVNEGFLNSLRDGLVEAGLPAELATKFVEGAFRNVAIQIHFNDPSLSVASTMHVDHINSALHMAITLHGARSVGFKKGDGSVFSIDLKEGDVYLTSPTSVTHGVSVPKLKEQERSVALQLRTLLDVAPSNELNLRNNNAELLFITVHRLLDEYQNRIRIPSFEEYDAQLKKEQLERQQQQQRSEEEAPNKIAFKNTFVISKLSQDTS